MRLIPADDGGASRILANSPGWAFFFAIAAVPIYVSVSINIAASMMPEIRSIMADTTDETSQLFWMIINLPQIAALIHVMMWAESKGMTAFAGRAHIPPGWSYAIMATPVIFLAMQYLTATLAASGDASWLYGEEGEPVVMSDAAIGLSMITGIVVIAPLLEEITMRGVALGFLMGRGVPPWIAIIGTSLLFAALHMQYTLIAMIPVFIMGCYFGWLRVKTGSVMVPILAHFAANGFVMIVQILGSNATAAG